MGCMILMCLLTQGWLCMPKVCAHPVWTYRFMPNIGSVKECEAQCCGHSSLNTWTLHIALCNVRIRTAADFTWVLLKTRLKLVSKGTLRIINIIAANVNNTENTKAQRCAQAKFGAQTTSL